MEPHPEPKKQSAIEFVKERLAMNPEATFADIKAQAKVEGVLVYPVVYGRAKALLGLVPTAPYGSKSKARAKAAEATKVADPAPAESAESRAEGVAEPTTEAAVPGEAGQSPVEPAAAAPQAAGGRAARARATAEREKSEASAMSSLEELIEGLKTTVKERDRYRATLEKIAELIRAELEG